ncbi:hypothetical protein SLS54_009555 [Diplodia seriata]
MVKEKKQMWPSYTSFAGGDHQWETPSSGIVNGVLAQMLTLCKAVDLTEADSFDQNKLKAILRDVE